MMYYVKHHWFEHFTSVNCMVWELYLNKAVWKGGKGDNPKPVFLLSQGDKMR